MRQEGRRGLFDDLGMDFAVHLAWILEKSPN